MMLSLLGVWDIYLFEFEELSCIHLPEADFGPSQASKMGLLPIMVNPFKLRFLIIFEKVPSSYILEGVLNTSLTYFAFHQ